MGDRLVRGILAATDKAMHQTALVRQCRLTGGHQWQDIEPVILEDFTLDTKCEHCGTLANAAYETAREGE